METDALQRHWEHGKTIIRARWELLTDDDVLFINGSKERLTKKLVERYDWTPTRASAVGAAFALELERANVPPATEEAGGTLRESTVTNPGGAQGLHPPRSLADGLRDALGGGSVAAGDF